MGSASMTVQYVATPTTSSSCATPLTSSVEYSGSSWSEKVEEKASRERGRVAEEGTPVRALHHDVHVRRVARRRDGHAADDAHHLECLLE